MFSRGFIASERMNELASHYEQHQPKETNYELLLTRSCRKYTHLYIRICTDSHSTDNLPLINSFSLYMNKSTFPRYE